MIQSKPPVTRWCNNLSLAGKRPVQIKLPLTQIQYLHKVLGFHSVGHMFAKPDANVYILKNQTAWGVVQNQGSAHRCLNNYTNL